MFSPEGPSLRELAVQALSSVERGYDLLAPKFDHTPFRTPDAVLDAVESALRRTGPFDAGLDLCCGTGAGVGVLAGVCRGPAGGAAGVLRPCGCPRTALRGRLRPGGELRGLRALPASRAARTLRAGPL